MLLCTVKAESEVPLIEALKRNEDLESDVASDSPALVEEVTSPLSFRISLMLLMKTMNFSLFWIKNSNKIATLSSCFH
jgi:hypothetical protein